MKVTIVMNGQTEEDYLDKIQGKSNPLLNDTGRRQVLRLKNKISSLNYDLCFISPQIRCFETAIACVGDRVEIIRDDRLNERDMGELEGRPKEEYNAFQFWDYSKNRKDYGIEPIVDVFNRCVSFFNEMKEKYSNKNIIIFVQNDKLEGNLLDGRIDNCSIEEFEI